MTAVNTKATAIINADASPVVKTNRILLSANIQEAVGTVEVAADDSNGSVYRFARVPSNARISSIKLLNDAITGGTAYEVGVYKTAANGGVVVDADLFASAVDLSSARVAPLDVRFEAADINGIEKRLWEVLGLTTDPLVDYDICLTGTTVGTAAGTISLAVQYCV